MMPIQKNAYRPKADLLRRWPVFMSVDERREYASPLHRHDCAMLFVPLCGQFDVDTGSTGQSIGLLPGWAALVGPEISHGSRSTRGGQRHAEIYVDPDWLATQLRPSLPASGAAITRLTPTAHSILRVLAVSPASAARNHLVQALCAEVVAAPRALTNRPGTDAAAAFRQTVETSLDLGEAPPRCDAFARSAGLSARQLQRLCLARFGLAPAALRRTLVAQRARAMLAGGAALAAVSDALGFASSGHLGRLLKETAIGRPIPDQAGPEPD